MDTTKLSFKGHSFEINPKTLLFQHSRNLSVYASPFGNTIFQDLGELPMTITCEGVFHGNDVFSQYETIHLLLSHKGTGLLYIPNHKPIYAIFHKLDVTASPTPNLLYYKAEFIACNADTVL